MDFKITETIGRILTLGMFFRRATLQLGTSRLFTKNR